MNKKLKITFLGTGAAQPTKKRNHTAILVSHGTKNILLDCGEGTQRQFRLANLNPGKLTHLLITHWHGDHTLGIPGLLETLHTDEYSNTLKIYGPKGTKKNLELYEKIYGRFQIKKEIKEVSSGKIYEDSEILIETLPMKHTFKTPANAYSIILKDKLRIDKNKLKKLNLPHTPELKKLQEGKDIKHPETKKKILAKNLTYKETGKKVTIILDTLKNQNAIKLAKNSDLLVTECSFSEADSEKAEKYKHLTTKQVGEIAKEAKAKKLIITHISRRYDNNPEKILKEVKKVFKKTTLSKDLEVFEI